MTCMALKGMITTLKTMKCVNAIIVSTNVYHQTKPNPLIRIPSVWMKANTTSKTTDNTAAKTADIKTKKKAGARLVFRDKTLPCLSITALQIKQSISSTRKPSNAACHVRRDKTHPLSVNINKNRRIENSKSTSTNSSQTNVDNDIESENEKSDLRSRCSDV